MLGNINVTSGINDYVALKGYMINLLSHSLFVFVKIAIGFLELVEG